MSLTIKLATNPSTSDPLKPRGSSWKRRGSEEDKDCDSNVKKPRYSWYVTLESESSRDGEKTDGESDESIYSIQDQETEYARDTSDTSTWISTSDYQHNMSFQVEYDVESLSESDNPFLNVSSSDPEDITNVDVIARLIDSEMDQQQEDTDESFSSFDNELGKADYWACVQCNMKNNNPLFRYCERCYQLRKNFFPPRPKRKKSKRLKKLEDKTNNEATSESQTLTSMDSGLGSSCLSSQQSSIGQFSVASSQSSTSDADTEDLITLTSSQTSDVIKVTLNEGIVNDEYTSPGSSYITGFEVANKGVVESNGDAKVSLECEKTENNSTDNHDKLMEVTNKNGKSDDNEDNENKLCLVCTVSPKNGAFVHGNVLHICCCYRCAVKVWKTTRHCPICKRKITNVLKAFYV